MTTDGDVGHFEDQPSAEVIRDLDFLLSGVGGELALGVERRARKKRRRTYALAGVAAIALVSLMFLPDPPATPPAAPQDLGLNVESPRSFVVMSTSRDDLTVVWLLNRE